MTMHPRIFIIGFNRCGTTSFHHLFEEAGLRPLHYDEGRLAVRMERNARAGKPVMDGYDEYDVFSDMFYACTHAVYESNRHFREIAQQEPDAKFILNLRDVDDWLKSRAYWYRQRVEQKSSYRCSECRPIECRLEMVAAARLHFGLAGVDQVFDHWRAEWHAHAEAVQAYLPPERLLVFDIDTDDPAAICAFAGLPEDMARHWGQHNRSMPTYKWTVRLMNIIPPGFKKRTPAFVKNSMRSLSYWLEGLGSARSG